MGCPKLNTDFFNSLEIVPDEKRVCGEKKRINYYPFGLKHKGYNNVVNGTDHPYGFGGKEEQDELGLNWIDITARNYDPALGRWMNLDPLAEMMRRHSPYNYAFNNPAFFIDPDGLAPKTTADFAQLDWFEQGNASSVTISGMKGGSSVTLGSSSSHIPRRRKPSKNAKEYSAFFKAES